MGKHTKEYAETIAATKYLYSKTEDSDLFIKAQEWCIDAYAKGYMKAIEETNVKELLEALKSAYECSGQHNYLTKPVLDKMLTAIKKSE